MGDRLVCSYKPRKRRRLNNIGIFLVTILALIGGEYSNQNPDEPLLFIVVISVYLAYIYLVPWALMRVGLSADEHRVYLKGFLTKIKLDRIAIEEVEIDVNKIDKRIELCLRSDKKMLLLLSFRGFKEMEKKLGMLQRFFPTVEPMLEDDFWMLKPIDREYFE